MRMTDFLAAEWKPALGCTEPAAVAWAAALAAEQGGGQGGGPVRQVRLVCDPRTYKNCYAVGLPNSDRATGILWALALGTHLPEPSRRTTAGRCRAARTLSERRRRCAGRRVCGSLAGYRRPRPAWGGRRARHGSRR